MTEHRPPQRVRVMLVDDHRLVRAAVRHALDAPDMELVGEAATAEEALLIAIELRPDILLVDINLPGMDGIQLVRELAPRLPQTRIVMLTVSEDDRDLVDAMRYGATGYLTKDLDPESLLRAIRSAYAGELAMTREMGGRLVRRLLETVRNPSRPRSDPLLSTLTDRERDVLRLLAEGLTDREMADGFKLSIRTIEAHVSSILHKLRARNRSEAARRFLEGTGTDAQGD